MRACRVDAKPAPVFSIPVMEKGRKALEDINSVRIVKCRACALCAVANVL